LSGTILIYGATGYTGKLIAKVAAAQGAHPILAGRDLEKIQAIAKPLELATRTFHLRDSRRIDAAIKDVSAVLCVAGPFSATSKPMAGACLRNRVHYLDITGEIEVFEALAARDAEAKAQGVTLLPGLSFDGEDGTNSRVISRNAGPRNRRTLGLADGRYQDYPEVCIKRGIEEGWIHAFF